LIGLASAVPVIFVNGATSVVMQGFPGNTVLLAIPFFVQRLAMFFSYCTYTVLFLEMEATEKS
jgi:hypothetical protein